ncbi:unnamed protein product [Gongylonema pulchrum]|uniref:Uncharacterized protein n=1 Tax=Gongylonema pulchrum TaxID=637853 RepID=A0A183ES63_9BILA|nr:unnamed protein product [Gongylonema pulchrum]
MPWCCGGANTGGTTSAALISTGSSNESAAAAQQQQQRERSNRNVDTTVDTVPKSSNTTEHFGPMLIQPRKTILIF